MKNKAVIIGIVLLVAVVVIAVVFTGNKNDTQNPENNGGSQQTVSNLPEDLTQVVDEIYKKVETQLPNLATTELDVADAELVQYNTGLKSTANVEKVAISEPLMTSQAYSLVLVKAKAGADIESMKKEMFDNIDTRKWICVEAEKVCVTNSGNLICLVMTNKETATTVFEAFKTVAGTTGKELQREIEI